MDLFYVLRPPIKSPDTPAFWSWSSLSEWRKCPRRWWLRRCRYDNTATTQYPSWVSRASLVGNIVHDALEEFCQQRGANADVRLSTFDAYRFIKRRLHDRIAALVDNPRVDRDRLLATFSLDECIAEFYRIGRQLDPSRHGYALDSTTFDTSGVHPPRYAEEFNVQVDDPPLWGRLDQIRDGTLVDFKTGDPDGEYATEHEEQLQFYSLIWWLRYRTVASRLELCYSNGRTREVSVPSKPDLIVKANMIGDEIRNAERSLKHSPPPTNVDVAICRDCPVRQLCDDFWETDITLPLRSIPLMNDAASLAYCDVRISKIPHVWESGRPLVGQVSTHEYGSVQLTVPGTKCPSKNQAEPTGLRILGAAVCRRSDSIIVNTTSRSEVFWTVD